MQFAGYALSNFYLEAGKMDNNETPQDHNEDSKETIMGEPQNTSDNNNDGNDDSQSFVNNTSSAPVSEDIKLPSTLVNWLENNNPLYLISVLLMLIGLYIAGIELEKETTSALMTSGFFVAQNIYELLMLAMGLYLIKNRIQINHGKILLFLVLIFLGDLTFYQIRLSVSNPFIGNIATVFYIILGFLKFAIVLKILQIKVNILKALYIASAFLLIWIAPKIMYGIVDSIHSNEEILLDPAMALYILWLTAGLIHLPILIKHWANNNIWQFTNNEYFGDESKFWHYTILFVFTVMPIQLFLNLEPTGPSEYVIPLGAIFAPWLVIAPFFLQTFFKTFLRKYIYVNTYDSLVLIFFGALVFLTTVKGTMPTVVNQLLLFAGLLATSITRKNIVNGAVMCFWGLGYTGVQIKTGTEQAVEYGRELSRVTWAIILILISFMMLGLGFALSLFISKQKNQAKKG